MLVEARLKIGEVSKKTGVAALLRKSGLTGFQARRKQVSLLLARSSTTSAVHQKGSISGVRAGRCEGNLECPSARRCTLRTGTVIIARKDREARNSD